jgi:prephenate dehydrogenase
VGLTIGRASSSSRTIARLTHEERRVFQQGLRTLERFGTVAIVGVGLIGGSVGLTLRARNLAERVIGIGRDAGRLDEARRLGAIDQGTTDLVEGVSTADIVVICTPVDRIAADVVSAAHSSPMQTLITDAGSTKRRIVAAVEVDATARAKFVAAHPIAGSEKHGPGHARPDLFNGRTCILTPTERTPHLQLDRARAFWSALGCRLVEIDPQTHDERLALTSHLPHAVAAALAMLVGPELVPLAAGAYRDGTRVAAAEAAIWTPIFLENRRAVLDAIDSFEATLGAFRAALDASDEPLLQDWWDAARRNRLAFEAQNGPERSPGPATKEQKAEDRAETR